MKGKQNRQINENITTGSQDKNWWLKEWRIMQIEKRLLVTNLSPDEV